ncbi:MAG: Zn-ribbon domain-containing OB-fold protein [Gammaproteobacteria bacterium]
MASGFGELKQGVFPTILKETHADAATQPFWDAAKQDRLAAPRCTHCGTFRLPPSPYCFVCQHREVEWVDLPGTGTVYSFTIVRHPLHPDLAACCPYAAGVVELDGTQGAGARMLVNIVDCDVDTLKIGDRVRIVFEHVNAEMSVPRFRPLR